MTSFQPIGKVNKPFDFCVSGSQGIWRSRGPTRPTALLTTSRTHSTLLMTPSMNDPELVEGHPERSRRTQPTAQKFSGFIDEFWRSSSAR